MRVEVGEHDRLLQSGGDDVAEDLLERAGVVLGRQRLAVPAEVLQVRDDELEEEALAAELLRVAAASSLIRRIHALSSRMSSLSPEPATRAAAVEELQVLGDRGQDPVAGLGDEVAAVVGLALVEDRGDVDLEAGAVQGDADGVVGDREVVRDLGLAVHLVAPLEEPLEELRLVDLDAADGGRPARRRRRRRRSWS